MSDKIKKAILYIVVLAYVLSPVDLMPGFLGDDAIVAIVGYLIKNRISKKEN